MDTNPRISTSIVRYILLYVMQGEMNRKSPAYHDAHRKWIIADQDVKRDWGW